MKVLVAILSVLCVAGVAGANLVDMSLDSQINTGSGDAIYAQANGTLSFPGPEGDDLGAKMSIATGSWWYGPRIHFGKAGYAPLNLSAGDATLGIDAKAFQGPPNTNPYNDCNIFVRIYSGLDATPAYRDFGLVYGPKATDWPFGDWGNWNRIVLNVNSSPHTDTAGGSAFNPAAVTQMRLYGTDWTGGNPSSDWIMAKDLSITPEPATLALLALGGLALIRRR